jgi:hypothetical protein
VPPKASTKSRRCFSLTNCRFAKTESLALVSIACCRGKGMTISGFAAVDDGVKAFALELHCGLGLATTLTRSR